MAGPSLLPILPCADSNVPDNPAVPSCHFAAFNAIDASTRKRGSIQNEESLRAGQLDGSPGVAPGKIGRVADFTALLQAAGQEAICYCGLDRAFLPVAALETPQAAGKLDYV